MSESKKYSIQENKILFNNSTINFDFPIQQSIEIDDMLIVRIDIKIKLSLLKKMFSA